MSDTEAPPVSTTAATVPRIEVPDNAVWFGYVSCDRGDTVPVAVIRHYGNYLPLYCGRIMWHDLPQYWGRIMWHAPTVAHGYRIMAAWALDPMRTGMPASAATMVAVRP